MHCAARAQGLGQSNGPRAHGLFPIRQSGDSFNAAHLPFAYYPQENKTADLLHHRSAARCLARTRVTTFVPPRNLPFFGAAGFILPMIVPRPRHPSPQSPRHDVVGLALYGRAGAMQLGTRRPTCVGGFRNLHTANPFRCRATPFMDAIVQAQRRTALTQPGGGKCDASHRRAPGTKRPPLCKSLLRLGSLKEVPGPCVPAAEIRQTCKNTSVCRIQTYARIIPWHPSSNPMTPVALRHVHHPQPRGDHQPSTDYLLTARGKNASVPCGYTLPMQPWRRARTRTPGTHAWSVRSGRALASSLRTLCVWGAALRLADDRTASQSVTGSQNDLLANRCEASLFITSDPPRNKHNNT